MLSEADIERIAALWTPDDWPVSADAYAIACNRTPFAYYVERIRHLGISGGFVIDAGCGSGRWSFPLATAFDEVLGFDYTDWRLTTALWLKERLQTPTVSFVPGDILNIPVQDARADAIYCNSVVIGNISVDRVLQECFRVLKPGGLCYLGLNGLGYAYELSQRVGGKHNEYGRQRIYNTYCQRHLATLIPKMRPRGSSNGRLKSRLRRGRSPAQVLADIGAGAAAVEAARIVDADLGAAYTATLAADLAAIAAGEASEFSHVRAGLDFEPGEIEVAARAAGFGRFEWARDGRLSLRPDGSVGKEPSPRAVPGPGDFEGRLRVFEMLIWKP